MELKNLTNWLNWNEWKSVIDDAYNPGKDLDLMRRAFSAILAWESRDSNIPSPLICLKELLLAFLNQIDKKTATTEQLYFYQLSISMNIVRFVNFITEPHQTNLMAKSIKSIAKMIDIPDWIVNLRHNATHFSLPSIEILENARDYLFEWLREKYVNTYKEIKMEKSLSDNVKLYVQNLFVDYMDERYKSTMIKSKGKSSRGKSTELDLKIEEISLRFRNETLDTLLEDGYLIPTFEQLNAIGIVAEEFISDDRVEIPKSFFNIWIEYLTFCNDNGLISSLFQKLIDNYKDHNTKTTLKDNETTLRNKFLVSWILCFIRLNPANRNEKQERCKFHFEFKINEVLHSLMLVKPNRLIFSFIKEVKKLNIASEDFNLKKIEKLILLTQLINESLVQLGTNQAVDEDIGKSSSDFIEFDLSIFRIEENNTNVEKFSKIKSTIQNHSDWKLIDDKNWNSENLKLGLIEGQDYENFSLDIQELESKKDNDLNDSNDFYDNGPKKFKKTHRNPIISDFENAYKENRDQLSKLLYNNFWEFSS